MQTDRDFVTERAIADAQANPIAWYVPRPTPRKFHLDRDHRTRFLFGGKQSSKTYSIVAEVVMAITGIESVHTPGALKKYGPPPHRWRHWCEDLTRVATGILYPIYRELIPESMLVRRGPQALPGFNKDDHTLNITHPTEGWTSTVQFLSYQLPPMKGESATLHGVAYDEPPPEKLYESQYIRLLRYGGQMIGAMTLDERRASHPIHWIDRRIRRRGDGKHVNWWRVHTDENIHALMQEAPTQEDADRIWAAYGDAKATLSEAEQAVVFEGRGGWAVGLVFPDFDENIHAAYDQLGPKEVVELAKKGYGTIRGGLDGGMDHPTAMLWIYTHGKHPIPSLDIAEGDHLVYREYKVRGRNYPQHAQALAYLSHDEPIQGIWGCESLWNRDKNGGPPEGREFFNAFRKLGIAVRHGNRIKRVGHNRLGEWFKLREFPAWPRLRFLKGYCQELVDETYGYSWKGETARTGKSPDETVDINDDLMDCMRYWGMSFPEPVRRKRQVMTLPRHPITGVPMPNFVDVRALSLALR